MKSRLLAALLAFSSLAVVGCDPLGVAGAKDKQDNMVQGSTFDPSAPENRVEPARFGKPGPAKADAARQLTAASGAYSNLVSAAPSEPETSASKSASLFDGARGGQLAPVTLSAGAPTRTGSSLVYTNRKMAIDTDGHIASPAAFKAVAARDKWRDNRTSLRYADGSSLDPTRVPFIVIPNGFQGASLGDMAYVTYRGKGAWAVVGDYGPTGHFGEASSALASQLGINPDGRVGGVGSGVSYTIFPGTGRGRQPNEAALTDYMRTRSAALAAPQTIQSASL